MKRLRSVCHPLCRYYKPEKPEESVCGGLAWLHGRRPPLVLDELVARAVREGDALSGLAPEDPRLLTVCEVCEYRVDGCDFRDPSVPRAECAPCGGLRACAALFATEDL